MPLLQHGEVGVDKMKSDERQGEPTHDEQIRRRREELLDEALEETFPASDPTSIARPHLEWKRGSAANDGD